MLNRKTKDITKAASEVGCEPKKHKGSHQHWECPKGQFGLVINGKHSKEQSPGLAKKAWDVIDNNKKS
jgi:predicted RNA binding protein YcfA (HicA-like mRNA interferase family)